MFKLAIPLAALAIAAVPIAGLGGASPVDAAPPFEGQNASQNCSADIGGTTLEDEFFGGNHGQCVSQVSLGHNFERLGANTAAVYFCTDPNNEEFLEEMGIKNQGQCVSFLRHNPDVLAE